MEKDLCKSKTHPNFRFSKEAIKPAFTLAEVLITLGIIGVVAAMTLPTLIQNHQKQTYVAGLKKGISIISNAFQKMVADEGVSNLGETTLFSDGICEVSVQWEAGGSYTNRNECEDDYGNPSVFLNILPKYLKIVKICNGEQECNITYKYTNVSCTNNKCTLEEYGNGNITNMFSGELSKEIKGFYTADGMIFYIRSIGYRDYYDGNSYVHEPTIEVWIDINGEKGPNIANRDLFRFDIQSDGKISGGQTSGYTYLIGNGWKMDY